MDPGLKQRLIGAAVLIALAVIFLPMLVKGPAPDSGVSDLSLDVPKAPSGDYVTRDLPLVVPNATTSAGLLDDGGLATVDTATAPPPDGLPHEDAAELAADVAPPLPEGAPAGPSAPSAEPAPASVDVAAAPAAEAPAAAESRTPAGPDATPAPATPDPAPAAVAAAAPAPAPRLPAATAGGDYAVSFGAYATRGDAGTVVERLRSENLPAYVEETRVGGRDAWRVRIGPYATRADAESARIRADGIGSRARASVVALDAPTPGTGGRAPAVPAAAAPSAAAGTGFAVQLGAFGNAAEATALRDRLRAAGIGAFTESVLTDRGTLTRGKAGPVATRAEAEQLRARVQSGFGVDGLVRTHP